MDFIRKEISKNVDITFARAKTRCIVCVLIKAELEAPMQKSLKAACSHFSYICFDIFYQFFQFQFHSAFSKRRNVSENVQLFQDRKNHFKYFIFYSLIIYPNFKLFSNRFRFIAELWRREGPRAEPHNYMNRITCMDRTLATLFSW